MKATRLRGLGVGVLQGGFVIRGLAIVLACQLSGSLCLGKTKVVVLPVVAIGADVPESVAEALTLALREDLGRSAELEVALARRPVEVASAAARTTRLEVYRAALAELEEGERQSERLRYPQAIAALDKSIAGLVAAPEFIENYDRLVNAYLLLAVAYFSRGQQSPGTAALEQLVRLRPDMQLDAGRYPPVFVNTFEDVRARLLARSRGSLVVTSAPPGARVELNGVGLGETPLVIDEIAPGENDLVVRGTSGAVGKTVVVDEGAVVEQHATLGGSSNFADAYTASVSGNVFDDAVRQLARRIAREQGGEYALCGAAARSSDGYAVAFYLGTTRTSQWAALESVTVDADLLSASLELHRVTRGLLAKRKAWKGDASGETAVFMPERSVRPLASSGSLPHVAFVTSGRAGPSDATARALEAGAPSARGPIMAEERTPVAASPPPSPPRPARLAIAADESHGGAPPQPAVASARPTLPDLFVRAREGSTESTARASTSGKGPVTPTPDLFLPSVSSTRAAPVGAMAAGPAGATPAVATEAGGASTRLWQQWWFWSAVVAGAAVVGGGTYIYLSVRAPTSATVYAVWR